MVHSQLHRTLVRNETACAEEDQAWRPCRASVLDRFLISNRDAREVVYRASNYDVNRIRFTNPFIPVIRFTVGTGLEIVSKHQRRHLLQAERIRKSLEFPRREPSS